MRTLILLVVFALIASFVSADSVTRGFENRICAGSDTKIFLYPSFTLGFVTWGVQDYVPSGDGYPAFTISDYRSSGVEGANGLLDDNTGVRWNAGSQIHPPTLWYDISIPDNTQTDESYTYIVDVSTRLFFTNAITIALAAENLNVRKNTCIQGHTYNDGNGVNRDDDADGDDWGFGCACSQDTFPAYNNEADIIGDCNDNNPQINPDAGDTANDNVDQDCDGYDYKDSDNDNYHDDGISATGYTGTSPNFDLYPADEGTLYYGHGGVRGTDCDDSNDAIYPGAPEVCGNGIDEDCDGSDELCSSSLTRIVSDCQEVNAFDVTLRLTYTGGESTLIIDESFIDTAGTPQVTATDIGIADGSFEDADGNYHIRWVVTDLDQDLNLEDTYDLTYTLTPQSTGSIMLSGNYIYTGDSETSISGDNSVGIEVSCEGPVPETCDPPSPDGTGIPDAIGHSSYAAGDYIAAPGETDYQWVIVDKPSATYCYSDRTPATIDASLIMLIDPLPPEGNMKIPITDTTRTFNVRTQNSGDLRWTMLTEASVNSPEESCTGTYAGDACYYSEWQSLNRDASLVHDFVIEFAPECTDGSGTNRQYTGTYDYTLQTWSDQWAFKGAQISDTVIGVTSKTVEVVDCENNADCETCLGDTPQWMCVNNDCCTIRSRECYTALIDDYCTTVGPARDFCETYISDDYSPDEPDENDNVFFRRYNWLPIPQLIGQDYDGRRYERGFVIERDVDVDGVCFNPDWGINQLQEGIFDNALFMMSSCILDIYQFLDEELTLLVAISPDCMEILEQNDEYHYTFTNPEQNPLLFTGVHLNQFINPVHSNYQENFESTNYSLINPYCIQAVLNEGETVIPFNQLNEEISLDTARFILTTSEDVTTGVFYPREVYLLQEYDDIVHELDEQGRLLYAACHSDADDTACCRFEEYCVFEGSCYQQGTRIDVDEDGEFERCRAASPGQWVDDGEINCYNTPIDDDGDSYVDELDSDCDTVLRGLVEDAAGPLEGARVDIVSEEVSYFGYTDNDGEYYIGVRSQTIYDVAASMVGYAPEIITIVETPSRSVVTNDFELEEATSPCQPDCTTPPTNTCDPSCQFWNGCYFSEGVSTVCNGKQPGFVVEYGDGFFVECCEGEPYAVGESVPVVIDDSADNIFVVRRPAYYGGRLVNVVVVVYQNDGSSGGAD